MDKMSIVHPAKGKISVYDLEEDEALMVLTLMPGLGSIRLRTLLSKFGSAIGALTAPPEAIAALQGFGQKMAISWQNWPSDSSWRRNFDLMQHHKASFLTYRSPKYPKSLLKIPDAPMMLYLQGDLIAADQRAIAIVGTRQASIYGQEMAKHFAHDLAALGFTVVSGLARGIDTSAHLGALETGRTIAVIGSGLGDIYPAENRTLAREIASQGAVISEFPMYTPPDRQNFPQRNRIVSGMCLGTLLIEAPMKSGAMITMQKALAQQKVLFAMPGRVDTDSFRANHHLIKQGAYLVESAKDIADHFDDLFGPCHPVVARQVKEVAIAQPLEREEQELLRLLPNQELSIEQILTLTQLPIATVNPLLMKLLLKGHLKEFPGKVYKKSRSY